MSVVTSSPDERQTFVMRAQSLAPMWHRILPAMPVSTPSSRRAPSETELLALLALMQFANIVDFMMVMPLAPDFALALGMAHSDVGLVAGSYTLAAMLAGLLGALFLDRLDRRRAVLLALLGLGLSTLAAALARDAGELYLARFLAGACGGPLAALAFAIVADRVPVARRGRALALVMSAFTLAAVLGVPLGLELARLGDWRTPFLVVGGLALAIAWLAWARLPPMREHIAPVAATTRLAHLRRVFMRPDHLLAYALVSFTLGSGFLIIPNLSAYAQFNLGYPREALGLLYLVGGGISFLTMQAAGRMVDRGGPLPAFLIGSGLLLAVVLSGLALAQLLPAMVLVAGFMVANSFRMVAINTLTSRVPPPAERAGFMALDSVAHHAAITAASLASVWLLSTGAEGALLGMERLGWLSALLALATLPLAWLLWRRLATRPVAAL